MKRLLKIISLFIAATVTIVLFLVVFVSLDGRDYARVRFPQKYFFLVKDCEEASVSAVAGDVYLSGGAGYYLEREGAVAVACYFKKTNAESVMHNLESKGTQTRVSAHAPKDFVLRGKKTAGRVRILKNAETVDSCARLLYDTANGLERFQINQSEARAAVRGVVSAIRGLREGNTSGLYSLWNTVLIEAERRGTEIADGLLFQKDLRYLQVFLCDRVVNISDYFS